MKRFSGKAVHQGIAMGPVWVIRKKKQRIKSFRILDPEAEEKRLAKAVEISLAQLEELYQKALKETGKSSAEIFQAHRVLLTDPEYLETAKNDIRREKVNAEYALWRTGQKFSEVFSKMEDAYLKERAQDLEDVTERLIRNLSGEPEETLEMKKPSIVFAEDLTPSETIRMDRKMLLGIVTRHGSAGSHSAILARMMNIPALTGVDVDLEKIQDGMLAVADGIDNQVILEPDARGLEEARAKKRSWEEKTRRLERLKGKESRTKSGKEIRICANIGNLEDLKAALDNDADGIGLFRSEFLYLGKTDFPSEEEQFAVYRQAVEVMGEKQTVIRTLDIGADKQADYFHIGKEENPALGYRAIRICLREPKIFQTQLRALLRAAVFGNLAVLYPMITAEEEMEQIQKAVQEAAEGLLKEGISFRIPEQGIMIETPAAVMISGELAQKVDFFSIGTNDLTQYALAVDRQNERVESYYRPHHKAVLRMIGMTVENAHKYGKWVGICGELGADLSLTEQFVKMGVDELSAAPSMVLPLREKIRKIE